MTVSSLAANSILIAGGSAMLGTLLEDLRDNRGKTHGVSAVFAPILDLPAVHDCVDSGDTRGSRNADLAIFRR